MIHLPFVTIYVGQRLVKGCDCRKQTGQGSEADGLREEHSR